jgi:hypothetical protein
LASIAAGGVLGYYRLHHAASFSEFRAIGLGASVAAVTALFAVGISFIELSSTLPTSRRTRVLRPLFGPLLCLGLMSPVAYLLCLVIRK